MTHIVTTLPTHHPLKPLRLAVHQIECGKGLGTDGRSLQSVRDDGYSAVFVGIGLPEPKKIKVFDGLTSAQGFYTSKEFLPMVAKASKPGVLCRGGFDRAVDH